MKWTEDMTLYNWDGDDYNLRADLTDGGGKPVIHVQATIGKERRGFYIQAAGMWILVEAVSKVLGRNDWLNHKPSANSQQLFKWIQERLKPEDVNYAGEIGDIAKTFFQRKGGN